MFSEAQKQMSFIACLLMAMAWMQPLHILPWVSWHSEVLAFLGLFLGVGIQLVPALLTRKRLQLPMAGLLPLAIALVIVCQSLAGSYAYAGTAIVIVVYILSTVLATVLGVSVRGPILLENISVLVILAAISNVFIAVIQSLGLDFPSAFLNPLPEVRRPGGNLGQANHLGTLLGMGVAALLFLTEKRKISGLLATVLGLVVVFGIAVTESRTAYVSMLGLLLWRLLGSVGPIDRRLFLQVVGIFVAFQIFWFCWPILYNEYWILGGSGNAGGRALEGLGVRWVVWGQLLEAVTLKPWFGWGFGGVAAAQNAVAHTDMAGEPFSYAHTIVLDFAVGLGLPLTLVVLTVSVVWLYRRVTNMQTLESRYAMASIIPLGVHSLFEFPFTYAYFLFPGFFFVGVLERERVHSTSLSINSKVYAALYVLMAGLAIVLLMDYVKLEEDFRNARMEVVRVGEAMPAIDYSEITVLNQLSALSKATRLSIKPAMSKTDIQMLKNVALIYPWSACQSRYALALALNGDPTEARRQLQVVRAMHGLKTYRSIKGRWIELSKERFPELRVFNFPVE